MKVYHGSYVEIKQIDLSQCEPHRDFGQGFYVTKFRQQAEFWAKRKSRYQGNGFVTETVEEQAALEPDDDFRRALSVDEFRERLAVVLDRVDKKYAKKCV